MRRNAMQRRLLLLLCLTAFGFLLNGCGGGSQISSVTPGLHPTNDLVTGRLAMTVTWPAPTRLIPQIAQSIRATVTSNSITLGSQLLARPASGNSTTVTFNGIPAGSVT